MICTKSWCEFLEQRDYGLATGVPCSSLSPIHNWIISSEKWQYLAAANEGQAVAIGAGVALTGRKSIIMMQNSGIGNAINPITSLIQVFELPMLLICSWRGQPNRKDEPQHKLMGGITPDLLTMMGIPHVCLSSEDEVAIGQLRQADKHVSEQGRCYAIIVPDGTFDSLNDGSKMPLTKRVGGEFQKIVNTENIAKRIDILRAVVTSCSKDTILVATTGRTGRELYSIEDAVRNFYVVGSMGLASSIGLGLSISTRKKIIVLDGDGAALMHLGVLSTIGTYHPNNFLHLILDNHAYESTGNQSSSSINVPFAKVATDCGYSRGYELNSIPDLIRILGDHEVSSGPIVVHMHIEAGSISPLPRPSITPPEVASRLKSYITSDLSK